MDATVGSGHQDDAMRALWSEAEQRLYPVAVSDPGRYERAVRIVRAVADGLRADTVAELVGRWPDRERLVADAAQGIGVPVDVPVDVVAGAAFSFRRTEILARQADDERRASIDDARGRGDRWVRLTERGSLEAGVLDPFQALDLHLPTGLAVHQGVETDPLTGRPNHVASILRMDPADGSVVDLDPGLADAVESPDVASHRDAVERLRSLVEADAETA